MLSPRYRADFAVLSDDILAVPPQEIDQVQVVQTWIGGELVFER